MLSAHPPPIHPSTTWPSVSTITFDPGLADPDPCTLITVAIANGSPRDFSSCAVPKTSSNIFNKKDARHYGPHKSEMAPKKISRKDAKCAKVKTEEGIAAKRRKERKKRAKVGGARLFAFFVLF
jgi:hypothetical protein